MADRWLDDFARGLRELRRRAGDPSYEVLADETGYAGATLAAADAGEQLPPLTVTLAYVTACGGNVSAWADRWHAVATGEPVRWPRRRRPHVVLLAVAGAAVLGGAAALLVGPTRQEPEPPAPVAAPVAPTVPAVSVTAELGSPPEYQAVSGPGCRMDFTRQTKAGDGWREAGGGFTAGDGCSDRYLYSLAGGDFQWRFMLDGVAHRRCVVEVVVPDSPHATGLVRYAVADRFDGAGEDIVRFEVDQAANRGWVHAATIRVGTAEVLIRTGDGGVAGPVRLSCARTAT